VPSSPMPPLVLNTRTAHIDIYPSTSGARARQLVTLNLVPQPNLTHQFAFFRLPDQPKQQPPSPGNPRRTLADIFVVFQKSIVPISVSTDRRRQRAIDKSSVYAQSAPYLEVQCAKGVVGRCGQGGRTCLVTRQHTASVWSCHG
jgi:hypothetical protein